MPRQEQLEPISFDRTKTLNELENDVWEPPEEDDYVSHLVGRCHALRTVPVGEMTPADLRILLGQNIGTEFLIPLALEVLERQPLINAELYPGDLLEYVLHREDSFWIEHPEWKERTQRIFARAEQLSRPNSIELNVEVLLQSNQARWRTP
ncbi:MAG: contact-dependent growth inhibition system immunity protein [Armatimonas sp.]